MNEGDRRVGMRHDSIILQMWDNMTPKQKADYIKADEEEHRERREISK